MEKEQYSLRYKIVLELLRQEREKAGLKQSDLAERLGVHQSFVSKIENAERRMDFAELWIWCEGIGIPVADFVKTWESEHVKAKAVKAKPKRAVPGHAKMLLEVKQALSEKRKGSPGENAEITEK